MKIYLILAIQILGQVAGYLILARIILSWFPKAQNNVIGQFLFSVTEPILAPFRSLIQRLIRTPMMLDFSPILAWLVIDYIAVPVLTMLVNYIFK